MAPTESGFKIDSKYVIVAVVVFAAVVWLMLSNMPPAPPPKEQPRVIKINATQQQPPPPPPQQPQHVVDLFMCDREAYRTRSGILLCGVEMVTDQYVFIRRGWIYAPNSTFVLLGDVSTCRFSVSINKLHLNCTNPIIVAR
jgi:hypothetical protein